MSEIPILLSGFADEAANTKTIDQQFSAFAAMGMEYFTIRFMDLGSGVKNIMAFDARDLQIVRRKMDEYGMTVSSIGSPIGKVKLLDVDDGTSNPFRPFDEYLSNEVVRVAKIAHALGTRLIRGFSFYHPKGSDLRNHLNQAVDQIGRIAETLQTENLILGLEVEANLIGQDGFTLAEIHRQIANPALVLIFDGGNLVMQGYSTEEIFAQYCAMKEGLGWIHIKDYRRPAHDKSAIGHVDEEAVRDFVPADRGDSGHAAILADLKLFLPKLHQRMVARGAPGVFVDLEPHLKGGGQFGGTSGPDGFGIALRAFCQLCDRSGIAYHFRDFANL